MSKKILFVSEIQDPFTRGSSTQILTENLLQGLWDGGHDITFIAIYDEIDDADKITRYYKKYTSKIYPVRSYMNLTTISHHKYRQLFRTIKGAFLYKRYNKILKAVDINEDTVLLSHTPSVEAAFLCKALLKKNNFKKYIQYWSDPYALSGIYPEKLSIKRWPNLLIESSLLRLADKVVYSGEPIYLAQRELYKRFAKKMYCVDFSYCNKSEEYRNPNEFPLFGYVGDYYSSIRNIRPLLAAFTEMEHAKLVVCGSGDVNLPPNSSNILMVKRKPQNEIAEIEAMIDVYICIINHSCLQLPGKIFYKANSEKIILVILDGKYQDLVREYLSQFNRFEFCENNKESIKQAIDKIYRGECKVDLSKIHRLSPLYITESILNLNIV